MKRVPIVREAYTYAQAEHVADAADLISAEARQEGCIVRRPFNGFTLEGRPDRTAAHVLSDWYYAEGRVREDQWRAKEREWQAEIKRLQDLVSRHLDAHDRALKATAEACRAAYAGGYAAGVVATGGGVAPAGGDK